jgi:hypothetical protein
MKAEHLVIRDLERKLSESQKENQILRNRIFLVGVENDKLRAQLAHSEFMSGEKNLAKDFDKLARENEQLRQQNKELGRNLVKADRQLELFKEYEAKGYIHKTPGTQV